ncbi:AbrB/MazE/SpoVT family DNA-binding domain-containing protein [Filifactor alocis]|uniref:AbrB/MazE/SpoVT family DNA-binding domain-containing protein n=1 Tax=Filifactor alocis TaxID=143361 RepID=UPI003FA14EE7
MLNEKKISKSGGITIPAHLRRQLGITAGEKVELKVDKNGNLGVERIEGSCLLCQTHDSLLKIDGIYICTRCAKKVEQALSERGGK